MNQKALKTLEFDKIIHILTAHAASEGAKEMCRKLVPYDNINDVERAQRETADALRRVYRKGSVSFGGIRDIRGSLKRLEIGGILGMGELLQIMSLLETAGKIQQYGQREADDTSRDSLDESFEFLDPVKPRKVLIHNDKKLEDMAYLFITDAPECILTDWCRDHAVEGQDIPQEVLEELIENGYEMKLLYPIDNVEVDAEDIAIIGYDEVYDINDKEYQPDREAENQKVIDSVKKAIVQYSDIDVVLNEEDGMLDVMYCSHNNSFPVEVTGAKLSHCDKEMLIHALDLMDVGHVGF